MHPNPFIFLKLNGIMWLLNVRILTNKPFEMAFQPVYLLQSGKREQPFSCTQGCLRGHPLRQVTVTRIMNFTVNLEEV